MFQQVSIASLRCNAKLSTEDLMGTWLSQFPMSHMPNLPFISAPELGPKEDLLVQAGLSGAPQQLPLKNNFEYDNHL